MAMHKRFKVASMDVFPYRVFLRARWNRSSTSTRRSVRMAKPQRVAKTRLLVWSVTALDADEEASRGPEVPRAKLCLRSELARDDLIDQFVSEVDIAILGGFVGRGNESSWVSRRVGCHATSGMGITAAHSARAVTAGIAIASGLAGLTALSGIDRAVRDRRRVPGRGRRHPARRRDLDRGPRPRCTSS